MAALSAGVIYGVAVYEKPSQTEVMPEIIEIPEDNAVYITITAIGDCTLGTDVNFARIGNFTSEVEANKNDYAYFMKNVKRYFECDDLTIANFEGTLSDGGYRAPKKFAFRGAPDYVEILSGSSVEAVNLANNHSKDYGDVSYEDTRSIMSANGITSFGIDEIAVVDVKGIKVGLMGTNALNRMARRDYPGIFEELKGCKPDMIIANFHWGIERAPMANKDQIALAHQAIDNGADLVIGHHPHVLQGVEKYKGKYILYSLGNFCFGGNRNPVDKDTMIFRQTFMFENGQMQAFEDADIIPCSVSSVKNRNNYQPTPLNGTDFARVKQKIINRSRGFSGIENINFIETPYMEETEIFV